MQPMGGKPPRHREKWGPLMTGPRSVELAEMDALAARLLEGERTTLGGTHIDHARRIAAAVDWTCDSHLIAAALLHDVLEKTPTTAAELLELTGDVRVVELVERVSQRAGEPYEEYLARCASDPDALLIKTADLRDKLTANDSTVLPAAAATIRCRAAAPLALLPELALVASAGQRSGRQRGEC